MSPNERIKQEAKNIEAELIQLRRHFHRMPELSMKEFRTAEKIAEELAKIDHMSVYTNLAGKTGVMGVLEGKYPGKCIILRADIDALPINEENDLAFKSENSGCMHACGHDAHITWVLGSAIVLGKLKGEFPGTVKFVFQPGEELGMGAEEMIRDDKVLENPKVDMAFAAHAWPSIEAGKIGIARRFAFGCPGGFQIKIKGKGGHGSWPHAAVNPIMTAAQICMTLPRIISERIDEVEPRVISIGSIHAGKVGVGNIIPDECVLAGTVRSTKSEIMDQILSEIEHVIKNCCGLFGAEYEYTTNHNVCGVENNNELILQCKNAAEKMLGKEQVFIVEQDNLGGENFSEFSKRIPSVYLYVGIKNDKLCDPFVLHSPQFLLDESVLIKAVEVFAGIVFEVNH
jgi:amidohydrolase